MKEITKIETITIVLSDDENPCFSQVFNGELPDKDGYYVFHAASKVVDGKIVTNGGRVLGVTAKGDTLVEARKNAYEATKLVDFDNKYMRKDIGKAIDEA